MLLALLTLLLVLLLVILSGPLPFFDDCVHPVLQWRQKDQEEECEILGESSEQVVLEGVGHDVFQHDHGDLGLSEYLDVILYCSPDASMAWKLLRRSYSFDVILAQLEELFPGFRVRLWHDFPTILVDR